MGEELKLLAKQFNNIYADGNWLGETFSAALDEIPAHIAFKKPESGNNSIAAIIHHIAVWREFFFRKNDGDKNFDVDQEGSFNVSQYKYASGGWQQLLSEYEESQRILVSLLETADDSLMERPVEGRKYTMGFLIRGLLQHDIYHLGQINLLKKQLQV